MTKRCVDSLSVVFNLSIRKALALPQRLTTHVLFRYDKKRSRKEFMILNRGIPTEIRHRIIVWLETHVEVDYVLEGLPLNEMDGDDLSESDAPWQVAEGLPKCTSMLSSQAERGLSGDRCEQMPSFDGF
jgi:hypothetical protein